MRSKKPRLTITDNLILRGEVLNRGSFFGSGSYKRQNAIRLTWEFKEATTDELIRLAYGYGKAGNSWVRMVKECPFNGH